MGWIWDKVGLIPPHLWCCPPSHTHRPTHHPAADFDIILWEYRSIICNSFQVNFNSNTNVILLSHFHSKADENILYAKQIMSFKYKEKEPVVLVEICQCSNKQPNKERLLFESEEMGVIIWNWNYFWRSKAHEEEAVWKK